MSFPSPMLVIYPQCLAQMLPFFLELLTKKGILWSMLSLKGSHSLSLYMCGGSSGCSSTFSCPCFEPHLVGRQVYCW